MITASAVFNFDRICNSEYPYLLPSDVLMRFAVGLGFPDCNTTAYTNDEMNALQYDVLAIWNRITSKQIAETKEIILTAGAPGVGKTTLIRRMWQSQPNYAYICPDDVCLKEMELTYGATGETEGLKNAYNKWKSGSNFAHHRITAQLVLENKSFFFGTTASSDKTYLFLEFLINRGYSIKILHVSAPGQVRFDSIRERDMVHVRIQDTFLKYASQIDFYYRPEADQGAILAATWIRQDQGPAKLEIIDQKAYEELRRLHDTVCENMGKPQLKCEYTVEKTL